MSTNNEQHTNPPGLDLLFSTTTGILYGLGVALFILFLFAISIDPEMLESLRMIFFGTSLNR